MEDKKKTALIITIVTIFLCGCPGLCLLTGGVLFSFSRNLAQSGWQVTGNPQALAIPLICLGVLLVAVPVVAGIITFVQSRNKTDIEQIDVPNPLEG